MKKRIFNLPNLLFLLIFICFFLPSKYAQEMRSGLKSPLVFGIVVLLTEAGFHYTYTDPKKRTSALDITSFVFGFLLLWEIVVSRLNLLPFVFVPAPENVFNIFIDDWKMILLGFVNSMVLIILGMITAGAASTILGTLVGWNERLTKAIYPIAKAISTVPALIYTPYIVLIVPTFRLASLCVIFLSNFWGGFMSSINNTAFVEKKIINAAKILNLSTPTILFKIIIPFNTPRLINALPIQLSTALMTLTVAEMLGADSGMGFYVRFALNYANYTKAIAGIIFIGLVVTCLNIGIDAMKKKLIKWSY
ncbi:MAG: ABC transporter permease subunit [Treponema sp.]|nr:ABC transporter permease subunit [Treponema sp.]